MSDERNDVERNAKNAVMDSLHVEQVRNQLEAAHLLNQPPSPMLKLDVDCFEELFEWLSLAELLVLRATCRRLRQVVDYYIQANYPSIQLDFGKLVIDIDGFEKLLPFDAVDLKLIKQITIRTDRITIEKMSMIKEVLPQIEKLEIGTDHFEGDFYESVLKWCNNLKSLSIYKICMNIINDKDNLWLHRQYPTIEHIELDDYDVGFNGVGCKVRELRTFLELNPNIRTLSTTFHYFWENRDCWLNSNIKLDRLNVTGVCYHDIEIDRICDFLNLLHDQGFYKRVHMYPSCIYVQDDIDEVTSVKGLEKLYLLSVENETTLSLLPDLKELCFDHEIYFNTVGCNVSNLMNVERVYFKIAFSRVLQPFIRHAGNVKEIQIKQLWHINARGFYACIHVINVSELNELRKELAGARKITIYVAEDIFLATKWATGITDSSLVKLKRSEAVDWYHEYEVNPPQIN